jgi:hypothetical protein
MMHSMEVAAEARMGQALEEAEHDRLVRIARAARPARESWHARLAAAVRHRWGRVAKPAGAMVARVDRRPDPIRDCG